MVFHFVQFLILCPNYRKRAADMLCDKFSHHLSNENKFFLLFVFDTSKLNFYMLRNELNKTKMAQIISSSKLRHQNRSFMFVFDMSPFFFKYKKLFICLFLFGVFLVYECAGEKSLFQNFYFDFFSGSFQIVSYENVEFLHSKIFLFKVACHLSRS